VIFFESHLAGTQHLKGVVVTRTLAIFLGVICFNGHALAADPIPYNEFLQLNNENSSKLSLGMTKEQVLNTMGDWSSAVRDGPLANPWRTEAFVHDADTIEVLFYLVRRHPPFTPILERQAISVVLKNGLVVAWGRNAHAPFK
jgi:hypothetical protein